MPRDDLAPLSPEDVKHLARIAGITIDESRIAQVVQELQALREDIAFIERVDVGDAEPISDHERPARA